MADDMLDHVQVDPAGPIRISRDKWEQYKEVITALYRTNTLPALRAYMAKNYQFVASAPQWKKKIWAWNLRKNLTARETRFIRKTTQRRHEAGKKHTQYRFLGQPIPSDKIKRHTQQQAESDQASTGTTPTGISYGSYLSGSSQNEDVDIRSLPPDGSPNVPQQSGQQPAMDHKATTFWQGQDMDVLLKIACESAELTVAGQYVRAKAGFMEALDGLRALVGPAHHHTILVLETFVEGASSNDDVPTALEQLQRSYDDHQQSLGATDARTWRSLVRLGLFHKQQGYLDQALPVLKTARTGLEEAYTSDAESSYIHTNAVTQHIIHILELQGDTEAAESEYKRQISKVDTLGGSYAHDTAYWKHQLVHLYTSESIAVGPSAVPLPTPYKRVESLLLDIVNTQTLSQRSDSIYICSVEQLRRIYDEQGERAKLLALLSMAENLLGSLVFADKDGFQKSLELRKGLARSFDDLGEPEKAERWLLDRGQQISTSSHFGAVSTEYLSNCMLLAKFYIDHGRSDQAAQRLHEAQNMARLILPSNHSFHSLVARALENGRIDSEYCGNCLLRKIQPQTTEDRNEQVPGVCEGMDLDFDNNSYGQVSGVPEGMDLDIDNESYGSFGEGSDTE